MFTNLKRNDIISNLKNNKFDLLVIGGGITGAEIALDATAGGLNTAVLEMHPKSNLHL
ncbi:FAD-binding protein [Mesobacillus sp. AQ2]|uniref:FAD-binding protein n=1 Tax=Bacillaceae TaxID=186817 RepID=UPI0011AA1BD2|nr:MULTISPECIES: FAD-binding protein [Bacillaceae]WHX40280.1 FAD-binding protein [Mesobacillus sp. AQ2]